MVGKIIVNYKAGQYGLAFFLQRKSTYYYVTAYFPPQTDAKMGNR